MYICKKMRLCTFLLKKGFTYVETRKDKYNPKRDVWLFKASPELYLAIDEYYAMPEHAERKKKKKLEVKHEANNRIRLSRSK